MKEYKLWKGLWKKEEYDYIENRLFSIENNNFESIFSVLKDYYIRFDALEFFYKSLF
jgi:hypothetical protein